MKISKVAFSLKSPGTQLSKYCNFWSCWLAIVMLRVSPQIFICPPSALTAHKNSYGSATGRIKIRAQFFELYLLQTKTTRNHKFQAALSAKPESGWGFSVCWHPWNFPSKIQFAGRGVVLEKSPLPSLEAFSVFLHILQSIPQLSGKTGFQHTSRVWDIILYRLSLSSAVHTGSVCVWLFL